MLSRISTLPLLQQTLGLILSTQIVSIKCFRSLDNHVEKTLLACKLRVGFRPRNVHFAVFLKSDHTHHSVIVSVVNASNFFRNLFGSWFLNSPNFERVLRASKVVHISQKHFVISGPILVRLLKQELRIHFRLTLRKTLPPVLRLFSLHVKWKLLSMDSNSLLTEFLSILLDHLLSSLFSDIGVSLSICVFLLHS